METLKNLYMCLQNMQRIIRKLTKPFDAVNTKPKTSNTVRTLEEAW